MTALLQSRYDVNKNCVEHTRRNLEFIKSSMNSTHCLKNSKETQGRTQVITILNNSEVKKMTFARHWNERPHLNLLDECNKPVSLAISLQKSLWDLNALVTVSKNNKKYDLLIKVASARRLSSTEMLIIPSTDEAMRYILHKPLTFRTNSVDNFTGAHLALNSKISFRLDDTLIWCLNWKLLQ
ncbi:hypothetical protein KAFR_0D02200 [Kazachstania africana CBS 2517]|uniref:Uncharacterized protein n=1 Tax=Kazachstania africana (strain ATCC 22294 / BCRC 22015 / CBS 2517 / CECT 1963 / NBRC 1671 / NRRL Y-8276) TaxID=1071382 RepID=H2AU17_KAZAF|nr:hypothetical protein KAFR_0D02200 [Kazachstania africana CBS 2517]CCF57867.1 hypothetical protein KAFR_0D02200 [Kazachstania africana CBS 2517]